MYLCNHTALDLGLEGTPDPSFEEVNARVVGMGYTGYVCPEYSALVPSMAPPKGGPGPKGSAGKA